MLEIDRRHFLAGAGAAFVATLTTGAREALAGASAVYASAFQTRPGEFGVATLAQDGQIVTRERLPVRGHGFACHDTRFVVFARRPGIYAVAFDRSGGAPVTFSTPPDRHFFGHGLFSPDGKLLYAAENAFESGDGMIGVYDATDGYRRIAEFASAGIDPHDMTLLEDGRTLCVANGGILTHPDYGRAKLNLATMQPSVAFIALSDGSLIEKHTLPPELSRLSLRHMARDARGRVWIGAQYEGSKSETPPLVAHVARGEELALFDLPPEQWRALRNYVGSVAANADGDRIAFTSPKGGAVLVVDALAKRFITTRAEAQVCGVAANGPDFVTSTEAGNFGDATYDLAWDNHIAVLA